jgi:hypothetical protein
MTRRAAEISFALALAAFGVVVVVGAREFGVGWSPSGPEPGTFPFYMGLLIVAASLANAAKAALPALTPPEWAAEPFVAGEQARRVLGFALPILGLVVMSLWLGLYVGMAAYLFGTLVIQNRYPAVKAALISLGVPIACYLLIERGFKVGLLKGPLEAWLGL